MNPDNLRSDPVGIVPALIAESQGCMNNLLLQSDKARTIFASDRAEVIPGIMALATGWKELRLSPSLLCTDLKLLFLMTALDNTHQTKNKLLVDHDALGGLTGLLNEILDRGKEDSMPLTLSDELVDLASVALKVLFNTTLVLGEDREEADLRLVCQALNNYFIVSTSSVEKRDALTS